MNDDRTVEFVPRAERIRLTVLAVLLLAFGLPQLPELVRAWGAPEDELIHFPQWMFWVMFGGPAAVGSVLLCRVGLLGLRADAQGLVNRSVVGTRTTPWCEVAAIGYRPRHTWGPAGAAGLVLTDRQGRDTHLASTAPSPRDEAAQEVRLSRLHALYTGHLTACPTCAS
ncbi:PH domain-containing protein [Kitasatospora sp. NPDC004289]